MPVYRADTYQLIRAGLIGGKGIPATVTEHPCVFVTLTAPSFGPVHARREKDGRVLARRPRRKGGTCPHGIGLSCGEKHAWDDHRLGEPLCWDCNDYTGAVLFNAITKLYRDLLTSGGRDGKPLAIATVTHLHAVLRKAFRDAVIVDELIGSNPVERAKRPRAQAQEPGTVWTIGQLRAFLATAQQHRLFAFFHVAAYTGARRGELLNLCWRDIDLDGKKITITGSTAVIASGAPPSPYG